ncbi:hypothetical protein F4780DRAFT_466418 [Xylariomycetidae sp. FL0641]|nr:hypothetical protein F4780DRAFT_466418 [Xylariomycetidae sp. FL0641]
MCPNSLQVRCFTSWGWPLFVARTLLGGMSAVLGIQAGSDRLFSRRHLRGRLLLFRSINPDISRYLMYLSSCTTVITEIPARTHKPREDSAAITIACHGGHPSKTLYYYYSCTWHLRFFLFAARSAAGGSLPPVSTTIACFINMMTMRDALSRRHL